MSLNLWKKKKDEVVCAFRVSGVVPKGKAPKNLNNRLTPAEVVMAHDKICDECGMVAWGTNTTFNEARWGEIKEILFFANSMENKFACLADVEYIISSEEPKIFPIDVYGDVEAREWKGVPYKTFLILKNFRELDTEKELNEFVMISDENILFGEQWLKPRFRIAYLKH